MRRFIFYLCLLFIAATTAPALAQWQVGPIYPEKPSNIGPPTAGPGYEPFQFNRYTGHYEYAPLPYAGESTFQYYSPGAAPYGPGYGAFPGYANAPYPSNPAPFVNVPAPVAPNSFAAPAGNGPVRVSPEVSTGQSLTVETLPPATRPAAQPNAAKQALDAPATQPGR